MRVILNLTATKQDNVVSLKLSSSICITSHSHL